VPRAEKEAKVKGLADRLSSSKAAVLAGYRGLTVHETAELRAALAEVDTRFSVVKNSLTRLAAKEAGLDGLADLIDGPTAIAFVAGDPVAGAKRLVEQSRRLPVLEVRGGFAEGRILSAEEVRALAALESREVMLGQFAGMATSALGRTAWTLRALQSRLAVLLNALREKRPPEVAAEDHPDADRPGTGGEEATRPEPTPPGGPEEPEETAEQPAEPGPEEGGGRAEEPEGGT
jgi:large subunit ribosomal protein L10